eukprot:jgi/Chrpa1/19271/Chrysochromulina_OHIO_Genome00003573-RA
MEYGMPPPPPSAPPSTAAITRAIEIAALELTRSALSSPSLEVSSRAPRHVRDKFLKASCAGQMSTEEVNSLVRSSCKGVHPLVQCVTAELRTVVDPRLERIRSGCNDMLKLRVADAVKAIRSPATAAISPADHAKRIIKRIDEAHAKAQAKLSAVMTTNVEAQRSSWSRQIEPLLEQGGPDSESVLGHELLARVCALAVELRCVKAYTTEEALNARLTEAAAVEAGVAAADMAEAVGQQAAVEEAIARLRLARDAAELGVALVAARMANVPASVVELAEMRLGEMRALPPTPRGAPPVTAPVTAPPVAPAASTAADDSAVPSALARPDGALPRALVRRMTEKERIEAAIAASRTADPFPSGARGGATPAPMPAPLPPMPMTARRRNLGALDQDAVQLRADDITRATDGWAESRVLGKGGFGTVFAVDEGRLGALGHSGKVAVKRMDDCNMQGVHQLQNEIDILALCRHEHLLPLLGFCLEAEARCLVYPLMAGGTLEDALASSAATPLTWKARVRILSATARALLFLHTPSGAKGVILHRDVKSANILLDHHLNAKLSDVGLALLNPRQKANLWGTKVIGHLSDEVTGTIGYLDPIYMASGMYTTMADAYAMGITMLVSFTGVDAVCAMRTCNEMLEAPSRAYEYADARAEWPNDETCTRLAQIIQGIVCGDRPSRRTPFDQAVSELDEVADELRLTEAKEERQKRLTQDQGAVAAVEGKAIPGEARVAKECQICMAAPREVRFACGHLVACEACTEDLLATSGQRVPQNKCPTCRARIVLLPGSKGGSEKCYEATYVAQDCPPPPQLDPPKWRIEESALFQPGARDEVVFRHPGMTGLHIGSVRSMPGRTVITGVTPGSPADHLQVHPGSEIVAVNGQSTLGLERSALLDLCTTRPLKMTLVLPASLAPEMGVVASGGRRREHLANHVRLAPRRVTCAGRRREHLAFEHLSRQ